MHRDAVPGTIGSPYPVQGLIESLLSARIQTFRVPAGAIKGDLTVRSMFLALGRAYFAARGEDIDKLSDAQIAERLHVKRRFVNEARR